MEIIKHHNIFPLKEKWKKLYESNPESSVYQSEEYAEIAFTHFLPYAAVLKVKPVFFEIVDDGNTIMIIPLHKNLLKNDYTLFGYHCTYGYIDFIYSKDLGIEKMEECFHLLSDKLKGSKLMVNRLRENSLLCQYLLKQYELKLTIECSHIDLPDTYDEYLTSLKKDWRHHVRTAYHRLDAEQKAVKLKLFYKESLPDEEFAKMMDIYSLRRKTRYEHNEGRIYELFLKKFDICTTALKKMDNVAHFILYIDDNAVAFCNGFISKDGTTITLPRLAINIEYDKFSPGILLLNESIKKICELGIAKKVDLIHGGERYKHELGALTHYSYEFEIFL